MSKTMKRTNSDKVTIIMQNGRRIGFGAVLMLVIAIAVIVVSINNASASADKKDIITSADLKVIVNVNELSTFSAIYNGIAKVENPSDHSKIDYYVSYKATVKAGIDTSLIDVKVNDETKLIQVILPKIEIKEINVDMASLDFIFINEKANTSTVSADAYRKCREDVEKEANSEQKIYQMAGLNAKNVIEALMKPFMEQMGDSYMLEVILED